MPLRLIPGPRLTSGATPSPVGKRGAAKNQSRFANTSQDMVVEELKMPGSPPPLKAPTDFLVRNLS